MKRFSLLTVTVILFVLCCCTAPDVSKDDINKIYSEIEALRMQTGQINNDISALHTVLTALQNQDHVTAVIPIDRDGAEVGYTLSFQHGGAVTIYHGNDGQPGASPVIGARQHTDGCWYWTVDGGWLEDENGAMVPTGGADGRDGVTPELKIDDDFWYVSYDGGAGWTKLGRASGEGASLFKAVDVVSSDRYVSLILSDGTEIRLQRYAEIAIFLSEQEDIEIAPGQTQEITYRIAGTCTNPKVSVSTVGGWLASVVKVSATEGKVYVTAPDPYMEGSVNVFASEGAQTTMEIITFVAEYPADIVDLGLSVKWATYNVGASKPEDYGDYFAWGEIEPYYEPGYARSGTPVWKDGYAVGYSWSTYKWCNGTDDSLTKYCRKSSYGVVDNETVLVLPDDVAHVRWGGNWRMPTLEEFEELIINCTWTWTTLHGVAGHKISSNVAGHAGKYIFLPAAGYRHGTNTSSAGYYGNYWSSSLFTSLSQYACYIYFDSNGAVLGEDCRFYGQSIRPVYE